MEGLTGNIARELKLPASTKGVVVDSVPSGSAAAEAGLRRGDVIQEVNRQPVTGVNDYQHVVEKAGKQPVTLLVNRDGTTAYMAVQAG